MRRYIALLVTLFMSMAALTACTSAASTVSGTVVSIAQIGELNSINSDVPGDLASERNAAELANLVTAKFYDVDADGQLVANELLGSVTVTNESPLRVTYALAETAKWSDGTDIDAVDLALSLAAAKSAGGANFYSLRRDSGLKLASIVGTPKVGDSELTLEFSKPVSDFSTSLTLPVAAHTVGYSSFGETDAVRAKQLVLDAITVEDPIALDLVAESYRSAFAVWQGITDDRLFVSSGPYRVESIADRASISLVANAAYAQGATPRVERVQLKYYADSTAAVAALAAAEVDITVAEDSGIASLGDIQGLVSTIKEPEVSYVVKSGASAEKIVFNFRSTSVFAVESNDSEQEALELRKAFLHLVPKTRIIAGLSQSYAVKSSDSLIFSSSMNYYDSSVSDNGLTQYLIQDVEKASEFMATSGLELPLRVRVLFDTDNPRAQAEWILLRERAASAGFKLKDVSSQDPSALLLSGEFDVFIGAQPFLALPSQNVFSLTSSAAFGYTSSAVDQALTELASANDERDRGAALAEIDRLLVADAYGMPLYEVPSMLIHATRIQGYVVSAYADSATWGYQHWVLPAPSNG